jgi:DNA-binding response OmpR family regulator
MTSPESGGAIVVVEDPFVSRFLGKFLGRKGYEVTHLEADDGVSLLRTGGSAVGLLITNLPGLFAEFADRVPLLYLAAIPDPNAASRFRSSRVLRKPFHPHELFDYVKQLLPQV